MFVMGAMVATAAVVVMHPTRGVALVKARTST